MSQENVEVVRDAYDLDVFTASSDAIDRYFRDYADEAFEFRLPPDYPEGEAVFRGRDGATHLLATMKDVWGEWRFKPERFIDAGDRVVVFVRILAQGLTGAAPIELQTAHVWTVQGGRATSVHMFRDRAEALEAAGLSEWAMSHEDADRIRRAYEVWNESGPAAVTEEFWAEDAVYREGPGWPDAGVYRGRAAALERMQSLIDLLGPIEVHLDELIEVGDGRLVACTRIVGESEEEAPYTRSFAVVHRLRDGLIVEADYYLDRSQALEAAGLRE